MDAFEELVRRFAESRGYWVKSSFKVELTKAEKRETGKPSIPRPEIDLILYKPLANELIALEVKSYLDSDGVVLSQLQERFDVATGPYKLFTCDRYRKIVFDRALDQLRNNEEISQNTTIRIGLAAGKVYRGAEGDLSEYCRSQGWLFFGPSALKSYICGLADSAYENDPYVIASKVALR